MSACAHQPASNEVATNQQINCQSIAFNSSEKQDCYVEEHPPYFDAGSLFGYMIFRAVVEGLVHGLVYH